MNRVMGPQHTINNSLVAIKSQFDPASVIGASLYMAGDKDEAAIIGAVSTRWQNEGLVADRVFGHLLDVRDSCGARSSITETETIEKSYMVPEHTCLNIPLQGTHSSFQLVGLDEDAIKFAAQSPQLRHALSPLQAEIRKIRQTHGRDIHQILPLRENYPSHFIVKWDITGSTELAHLRGIDKNTELMGELSDCIEKHFVNAIGPGSHLLARDGGDAFWATVDLTAIFGSRTAYESHFSDFLNNQLFPAIQNVSNEFAKRADALDMDGRTPLKAFASVDYLSIGANAQFSAYFSRALVGMETLSSYAPRDRSPIIFGDDLINLVNPATGHMTVQSTAGKAAMFSEKVASLDPIP